MTEEERIALIHAELDGELDGGQRADLARLLLAEPQTRVLRDQLQALCSRLDAAGQVEPPPQLKDSILKRLPQVPAQTQATYPKASLSRWRLAALIAGLNSSGLNGPRRVPSAAMARAPPRSAHGTSLATMLS